MLSFVGASFPYLVIAAMSMFAGVLFFVSVEESILARREGRAQANKPLDRKNPSNQIKNSQLTH